MGTEAQVQQKGDWLLITEPNGRETLFDLGMVQKSVMDRRGREGATLTIEFKHQGEIVFKDGPWVDEIWNALKERAGIPKGDPYRGKPAFGQQVGVTFSEKSVPEPKESKVLPDDAIS